MNLRNDQEDDQRPDPTCMAAARSLYTASQPCCPFNSQCASRSSGRTTSSRRHLKTSFANCNHYQRAEEPQNKQNSLGRDCPQTAPAAAVGDEARIPLPARLARAGLGRKLVRPRATASCAVSGDCEGSSHVRRGELRAHTARQQVAPANHAIRTALSRNKAWR
jgi:hypothetical protein